MGEKDFNKKMIRGARVIRVAQAIEVAKTTLESQLPLHEQSGNNEAIQHIKGKIEGLELAMKLMEGEFCE